MLRRLIITDRPSIAVLPIENLSEDRALELIANGLAEDIIALLARVPGFFVIARASSFIYRPDAAEIRQVGAELGVRYVVTGSARGFRRPRARHHAARRGGDEQPAMGRALRCRARRHARPAGRDRAPDHGRAGAGPDAGGPADRPPAPHRQRRRVVALPPRRRRDRGARLERGVRSPKPCSGPRGDRHRPEFRLGARTIWRW